MKKRVTISMDEELLKAVKIMADKEGRNVSNMIEFLIRRTVEEDTEN